MVAVAVACLPVVAGDHRISVLVVLVGVEIDRRTRARRTGKDAEPRAAR